MLRTPVTTPVQFQFTFTGVSFFFCFIVSMSVIVTLIHALSRRVQSMSIKVTIPTKVTALRDYAL